MDKGSGRIASSISCHSWSPDLKQIALSPGTNEVLIFEASSEAADTWTKKHTLTEHDSFVSGVDWSKDNLIVSCGHDRNAYVWTLTEGEWKPTLVILRISRAATSVKWCPSGKKFAVTSGAKVVPVCHYEQDNDWWVSQLIKKHKSTVLDVDWHPNSKFIVTGSTDFKCRVFSAYMSEVEEDTEAEHWGSIFPKHNKFGALLAEFDQAYGWVQSVAWAPSGFAVGFVAHDSTVHFAHFSSGSEPSVVSLSHNLLPFMTIKFLGDNTAVAGGFDFNPMLFVNKGGNDQPDWEFAEKVDKEVESASAKGGAKSSTFKSKFSMFQDSSNKGMSVGSTSVKKEIKTVHQNTITQITAFPNSNGTSTQFCTSGIDGILHFWDLGKNFDLSKLKLV